MTLHLIPVSETEATVRTNGEEKTYLKSAYFSRERKCHDVPAALVETVRVSPPNSVPDLIIQRSELGGESIQPRETLSIYANVPRRGAPGKPGETPFSGARSARHPSPLGGAAGERRRAPLRPPPASLTVAALVLAQPVLAAQEVEGRVEVAVDLVHAVADGLERHPPVGALRRLRAARRPRAQPGAAQQRQQRQRGAGHAERRPAEPRRLPAPAAPRPLRRRRHRPAGSAPARSSQGAEPAAARSGEVGRAFPRPQVPGRRRTTRPLASPVPGAAVSTAEAPPGAAGAPCSGSAFCKRAHRQSGEQLLPGCVRGGAGR